MKQAYSPGFRVVVIGPGAVGLLFGGLLSHFGFNVLFLDKTTERAANLSRNGLIFQEDAQHYNVAVEATADVNQIDASDVILLCVKSYDVASSAAALSCLEKCPAIITLQNGIGHLEEIRKTLPYACVIPGITFEGVTFLGRGHIKRIGKARTYLGTHTDPLLQQRIGLLTEMLTASGLEADYSENIEEIIWNKLLVNVGINAISSIVGLKNGDLAKQPELLHLMQQAIKEAANLARAKGIETAPDIFAQAVKACAMTAENRSSMLQDVLRKKRTEIEAINGAIVKGAAQLGIDAPVNQVLVDLVKAIEKIYQLRVKEIDLEEV